MKRHPALQALSADHHHGLVQARRLLQADEAGTAPAALLAIAQTFLAVWQADIRLHFRAEEEVLFPAFARYGDPAHPLIVRVLGEHMRIRQWVADLEQQVAQATPQPATMLALGELLRAHIRLEEDQVFPLLEQVMPEAALAVLPAALAATAP
jgi:hemerythrin-like domain-containing protein